MCCTKMLCSEVGEREVFIQLTDGEEVNHTKFPKFQSGFEMLSSLSREMGNLFLWSSRASAEKRGDQLTT